MIQANNSVQQGAGDAVGGQELIRRAEQRVRQGLAPPPEIYRVEYRQCVNWSNFPGWAQPVDPQIFEGSCHEG
jgi:hypothetical protein